MIDALAFMHDGQVVGAGGRPVVHRDVKPENVLIVQSPLSMPPPTATESPPLSSASEFDDDGGCGPGGTTSAVGEERRVGKGNGAGRGWDVRLCDFGSASIGRTPLTNPEERRKVGEHIRRSTTQMYRAPEMVDLHMRDELTER